MIRESNVTNVKKWSMIWINITQQDMKNVFVTDVAMNIPTGLDLKDTSTKFITKFHVQLRIVNVNYVTKRSSKGEV